MPSPEICVNSNIRSAALSSTYCFAQSCHFQNHMTFEAQLHIQVNNIWYKDNYIQIVTQSP